MKEFKGDAFTLSAKEMEDLTKGVLDHIEEQKEKMFYVFEGRIYCKFREESIRKYLCSGKRKKLTCYNFDLYLLLMRIKGTKRYKDMVSSIREMAPINRKIRDQLLERMEGTKKCIASLHLNLQKQKKRLLKLVGKLEYTLLLGEAAPEDKETEDE